MKERLKNPTFWVILLSGIGSQFLTLMDLEPHSITTWRLFFNAVINFIHNPYCIWNMALFILAEIFDPKTPGLYDGEAGDGKGMK